MEAGRGLTKVWMLWRGGGQFYFCFHLILDQSLISRLVRRELGLGEPGAWTWGVVRPPLCHGAEGQGGGRGEATGVST